MVGSYIRWGLLCLALLISACRAGFLAEPDELPLEGPTWTLTHVDLSGSVFEPRSDETYAILFDTLGILRGRAHCNDCNGSFRLRKNDTLVLTLGCTEAGCGPDGSSLGQFPAILSGVFAYELDESHLELRKHQSNGRLTLFFDGK